MRSKILRIADKRIGASEKAAIDQVFTLGGVKLDDWNFLAMAEIHQPANLWDNVLRRRQMARGAL
jgi:hypothetical protein